MHEAVCRKGFVFVLAGIALALNACAAARYNSEGLEDLLSCRLQTKASGETIDALILEQRSVENKKASSDLSKGTGPARIPEGYNQLKHPLSGFGTDIEGYHVWGMHGVITFSFVTEAKIDGMKSRIERLGTINFKRSEAFKTEYVLQADKTMAGGFSLGNELGVARSADKQFSCTVLLRIESSSGHLVIGAGFRFNDRYR